MQRTARRALPAFLITTALLVGGCGGGEDESADRSRDVQETGGGESQDAADEEDGEAAADDAGAAEEAGPTESVGQDAEPADDPEAAAAVTPYDGVWLAGAGTAELRITDGEAVLTMDAVTESGDQWAGSVTGDALSLTERLREGAPAWTDTEATLALEGDRLLVTWSSGAKMLTGEPGTPDALSAVGEG
ncbi:hypothetical protein RM844_10175 [Streptomyces sp. DSM 44915]|uniref:Lipoprotein n=1 Tax=Streptomyces chisholmiae TaxID=3075540 RepID=A0ABU2JNT7_9ACTN|nr:hypothetical protein [Streptomyces sp. DSM 44915]MDT0266658.1 hypothetical protein [Streptomyces sp. DSM 44915]